MTSSWIIRGQWCILASLISEPLLLTVQRCLLSYVTFRCLLKSSMCAQLLKQMIPSLLSCFQCVGEASHSKSRKILPLLCQHIHCHCLVQQQRRYNSLSTFSHLSSFSIISEQLHIYVQTCKNILLTRLTQSLVSVSHCHVNKGERGVYSNVKWRG